MSNSADLPCPNSNGICVWSNKNPNNNDTLTVSVGPNKQCSLVSLLRLTEMRIFHQICQWRKYLGELRGKYVYLRVCVCICICEKMVCAFLFVCVFVRRIVRSLCVFVNQLQRLHKHPHLLITTHRFSI